MPNRPYRFQSFSLTILHNLTKMQAQAPSCRAGCRAVSACQTDELGRADRGAQAVAATCDLAVQCDAADIDIDLPCNPRVGMRAESMPVLSPPKLRIASEAISEQQMPDEPPLVGDVGTCPSEGAQTRTSTSCVAQPQIAVGLSEKLSDEAVPQAEQGAHNRCCAGSVSSSPQPQIAMPTDRMHKSETGCF